LKANAIKNAVVTETQVFEEVISFVTSAVMDCAGGVETSDGTEEMMAEMMSGLEDV
jgi:hypothetical protein